MSSRHGRKAGQLRFDLHMHSNRSDGELPPEEVLARCAKGGLDVVAITDHDIAPAVKAGVHNIAGRSVRVIAGVEISGVHEDKELHLLVYFPGELPESFRDFLHQRVVQRARRYDEAVRRMGLAGMAPAPPEAWSGERAVTRLHLSQALVEAGHARGISDAFGRFTGREHGNVPAVNLSFLEAVEASRAAGGFTSWAHPDLADAERWAGEFQRGGLQALETTRPSVGAAARSQLQRLAVRHGLLFTGGSDWHGWNHRPLGQFSFPEREARGFAEALGLTARVA